MENKKQRRNFGVNSIKTLCTLPLFLLPVTEISATSVYAQSVQFTFSVSNSTVKEVLNKIENESEFVFVYYENTFDPSQKVTINANGKDITEVLNEVFTGQGVSYEIIDRQIVLKKENKSTSTVSQQQTRTIKGVVKDNLGEPIIGANILVKGTTSHGVITDIDGNFVLEVPTECTLLVSYIGFKTQEIKVTSLTKELNISLKEDSEILDEVVVVGYGTQRKGNLTGSISSVKSKSLTVTPVASTANALAGRLPGLTSLQSSGQPGADAASLSIRGFGDALVIVDGVESSFNNIDPNQIESISILKDGSASIYGARAGNGVILVTTKRGIESKPTFSLNASATMQGATAMLKPLTSGQSAELKRESHFNAGGAEETAPYSEEQVRKYYEGTDPLFPNTDWYNILMRNWAPQQQYNLSVRGGSEKIKYYGFIGYTDQETMIKKNGGNYRRYNLQSNIDAKITDNFSFQLDIAGIHEERNSTARNMGVGGFLWQDYWTTSPMYPSEFPDPTKVPFAEGGGTGGLHVTSDSELSGYNRQRYQKFQSTLVLNYTFPSVTGLSAKILANYIQNYTFTKNFTKNVLLYKWDPTADTYTVAGSFGENALNHYINRNHNVTFQGMLNYNRTFKDKHSVNASAIFECIDYRNEDVSAGRRGFLSTSIDYLFAGSTVGMYNDGSASEMGRMSFVGRFNYGYKNKYLLEAIIRADASAKFAKEHRWGYFPSVSLGWVLSEEDFMKRFSNLSNLKLRMSYGRSGNDAVGAFQYLSGYGFSSRIMIGSTIYQGLAPKALPNPYLTWETMDIYNVGVDFSLLNSSLYGEAEVFYRDRKGIPANRLNSLPSTFGSALPQENINSINNRGFELMLGYRNNINDFSYDISGNISYSRAKWGHYEEAEYTDPDQKRINQKSGQWTDRTIGYKSDGLFTSQAEIDALGYDQDGQGNKTLKPGDIKIVDTNNDGVIDWKDQIEIGKGTTPNWMFGMNVNLQYKGFDLSMLFQGAFGFYKNFTIGAGSRQTFDERWTEENNVSDALVPRVGSQAVTAGYFTDYSYRSSNYLRLKVASLGYSLPRSIVSKINLENVRFSISGTNLLTLSKLYNLGVDPEAPNMGNYYPQQRTVSFGINVTF